METVHRLNIGGTFISPAQDTGMFREWSNDYDYLLEPNQLISLLTTVGIGFSKIPDYTAPQKMYQSSWSMDQIQHRHVKNGNTCRFTWKLPVDVGFSYLVRLHFCELDYETKDIGEKTFKILINNQTVESNGDLIKWGVEIGVAFYRDYVVSKMVNRDLFISLCPHRNQRNPMLDAVLKGLEVFKLSNDDHNLAGETITVNVAATLFVGLDFGFLIKLAATIIAMIIVIGIIFNKLAFWRGRFVDNKSISSISLTTNEEMSETCKIFTLNKIRKATNNFSDNMLIRGNKFFLIYKGFIRNDKSNMVTVKRFIVSETKQGANHEFTTEIEILSKLRHKHVIKLIGYCADQKEKILVYEHMAKGSLADHVYKRGIDQHDLIKWDQKLDFCLSAARGLDYIHTGTNPGIIHRDVKSSSILLDEKYVAKIADFGFCKMSSPNDTFTGVSTDLKGTTGFKDPDYFLTRWVTKKSDVYAFGVVLWEVLCGRPAILDTRINEQRNLAQWAKRRYNEKKVGDIVDPTLMSQISPACLKLFAALASVCSHNVPIERPSMADVVASLERAADLQRRRGNISDHEVEQLIAKNKRSVNNLPLSQDKVDAFLRILKLHKNELYELDDLCDHLNAYKTLVNSLSDKRITERFGERVRASLVGFENVIKSQNVDLENKVDETVKIVIDYMKAISHYDETINTLLVDDNNSEINPTKSHFISLLSILKSVLEGVSTKMTQDKSFMHIFLMNQINNVAQEVQESIELTTVLGDDWVRNLKGQVNYHKLEYEKITLGKLNPLLSIVSGSINKNSLRENLKSFNNAFEGIYKSQTAWHIPDPEHRQELRVSVSTQCVQAYRRFVHECSVNKLDKYIKYSPDDLLTYSDDLFEGCPKQLNNRNRRQS